MVAIKVAADGRVLPAQFPFGDNPEEAIHVESLPEGNVLDYKYINGEFVYDPLPIPEPEPTPEPSTEEILLEMAVDHEERLCMMELGI